MTKKDSVNDDSNISLYSDPMSYFVGETLSTADLDLGCAKSVRGKTWLEFLLVKRHNDIIVESPSEVKMI